MRLPFEMTASEGALSVTILTVDAGCEHHSHNSTSNKDNYGHIQSHSIDPKHLKAINLAPCSRVLLL